MGQPHDDYLAEKTEFSTILEENFLKQTASTEDII